MTGLLDKLSALPQLQELLAALHSGEIDAYYTYTYQLP